MVMVRFVQKTGECILFGLSSDTKPAPTIDFGFIELDTGKIFQADGGAWVDQSTPLIEAVAGSGGGVVSQTEIDFGATPVSDATFTITDAAISAAMKMMCSQSYDTPTGKDQDENEMDQLLLIPSAGTGQFTLYAKAVDGSYLADKFKVNYTYA